MAHILGIKFSPHGQLYYFNDAGHEIRVGDRVMVSTEQGPGLATVATRHDPDQPPEGVDPEGVKSIDGPADETNLGRHVENLEMARAARGFARRAVRDRDLDMKLVDVEVFHDRSKIVFYFTAPARIDFRELVKDLVKEYHTRIELRQIGVRHETQMIGAIGNCGMVCCCRRFLRSFSPVTIKMAKEQNLFLNPAKISGICGRLLCCLGYEHEHYELFHKRCPKLGKRYTTKDGPMKVLRANVFREAVVCLNDLGDEVELKLEEWEALEPKRMDPAQIQARQNERQERAAARQDGREARGGRKDAKRGKRPPRDEQPKGPGADETPDQAADRTSAGAAEETVDAAPPVRSAGFAGSVAPQGPEHAAERPESGAAGGPENGQDQAADDGRIFLPAPKEQDGHADVGSGKSGKSRNRGRRGRKPKSEAGPQTAPPSGPEGGGQDQRQSATADSRSEGDKKPRRRRRRKPKSAQSEGGSGSGQAE